MVLKFNKNILFILAVLSILIIIPCSFASDLENNTLSIDDGENEITVDDTTIYVSNNENNGDGSIDNPYNSISQAVSEFNSSENSDVYIKNGNYEISEKIELDKDITIIGETAKGTILDAGNSKIEIFKVTENSKITLINLTLKNSNSDYGALYIDAKVNLKIENCIFENNENSAVYHNYVWGNDLTIDIANSNFTNNKNSALNIGRGTSLNITNCVFENNANSNMGGAIYLYNNIKNAYIYNSKFINNSAVKGSAVALSNAGNLYVENSEFRNNNAPTVSDESSVIYDLRSNNGEVTLTLNKNTFTDNTVENIYTKDNVKVEYLDKNTKLTGEDVDKYYGDDFNYIVTLTDENGTPLTGKKIITTLTNNYNNSITTIETITNSEGIAVFSLKTQNPGKYSVSAQFTGDDEYDDISVKNSISIRTENAFNIIFTEDNVHVSEGDSYNATAYIYNEYMVPEKNLNSQFSVDWYDNFGKHLIVQGGLYKITDGNKLVFDINRCHLVTRDAPYKLNFTVESIGYAVLTVDLSKNLSNIDPNLEVIYVSKERGNDETGNGTYENPLATIQTALSANYAFGGGKTIIVDEGVYEISNFNVLGDVTVIGVKGKTILKQTTGRLGMLEIYNKNTVNLINLSFTNGYATPIPESLIHVTEDSTVNIDGCEFYNNSAYAGGAIAISAGGSAYITNSYFHENKAILNTNVGGVIYTDRGYLYISNSTFENNTACDGGVIFLGFEAEADIIDSTFINNTALVTTHIDGGGGAIFTRSNNLNIENCSFIENYAELCGGAIYIDYGSVNILKSYFENNKVKYNGESKGSAIESTYTSLVNITMHYSILVSDSDNPINYLVLIHEIDENHTVDLNSNFWKTPGLKASFGASDEVKITVNIENEYIYTGDIVEFTIELVNYNTQNGTSPLDGNVRDLNLLLIPKIGKIENPEVTVKNNKATFTYNATTVGEETIQIGDLLLYTTHKFDVQDGSDKIDLNPKININPGKVSEIIVSLDYNIENNITIRVNDDDYTVNVSDSKAVLKIDTLPGEYNVKVIYTGNGTYRGFVITDIFNVSKFASSLEVNDVTTYFNGDLEVKLLTDEGTPIANEIITIKINETEYTVKTNNEGIGILELNLDSIGIYNVSCIFSGNNHYNASEANSTLTIEFANINLKAEENVNITPIKGSFSFTLTDDKGNFIKNTDVIITFNKKDIKVKTDSNGIATINLDNNYLEIGSHNISAKVEKTKVYGETSINSTLNVVKAQAIIKAENISVYANSGNLTVILVDENGNPINNTKLIILITKENEVTTDENGSATLDLDLTPGNYTASIKLAENDIYTAKDVEVKIAVKETITLINAPEITVYYSNGVFYATLVDVTGKAIENARIIININNNNYIATTDENGTGSVNINNLGLGSYKAIITYEGNELFQPSTANSTINVVSSIISNDIVRTYNSEYDFIATLKDFNGNPIANTEITFIVNGKSYTANTDSNGSVKLTEKLAVNNYAITFTNPITGERTSNYAQIISRFVGAKDIKMDYYDGTSYMVRVLDDNGNPVGAGEIVAFKINGKTHKVKTNSNGYASVKIINTPKTYTITATYKEQTIKNLITVKQILKPVKKTIKVKKSAKKLIIKAKLKLSNGKAIKGKKVTFKIKGKKYNAKTNKKGIVKVTIKKNVIKKLKKGKKYTVSITYLKDTVKCYVKVKK